MNVLRKLTKMPVTKDTADSYTRNKLRLSPIELMPLEVNILILISLTSRYLMILVVLGNNSLVEADKLYYLIGKLSLKT